MILGHRAALVLAGVTLLGACRANRDEGRNETSDECSARGISAELAAQENVPSSVLATRGQIALLAVDCDYEGLEALGQKGEPVQYSFGDDGAPAKHWREQEKQGDEVLLALVRVLKLPAAVDQSVAPGGVTSTTYVWPSAARDNPTEEDWAAVLGLYSSEEIAAMREGLGGYAGYRVGITSEGDWIFFLAGD